MSDRGVLRCRTCSKTFHYRKALLNHQQRKHPKHPPQIRVGRNAAALTTEELRVGSTVLVKHAPRRGKEAKIVELPVHPATWFTVKLQDGSTKKCQRRHMFRLQPKPLGLAVCQRKAGCLRRFNHPGHCRLWVKEESRKSKQELESETSGGHTWAQLAGSACTQCPRHPMCCRPPKHTGHCKIVTIPTNSHPQCPRHPMCSQPPKHAGHCKILSSFKRTGIGYGGRWQEKVPQVIDLRGSNDEPSFEIRSEGRHRRSNRGNDTCI
jgi:hypothetical protein